MNREITFRGRLSSGEWCYGDLEVRRTTGLALIHQYKQDGTYDCSYKVYRNTVGQFSGLCDKHGVKIFEGDVVRWDKDDRLYVVEFRQGMFYASVEPFNKGVYGGFPLWFLCEEEHHCSVLGNTHDIDKELGF